MKLYVSVAFNKCGNVGFRPVMAQLRHRDICYFYQELPLYKSGMMKQNWKICQKLDFPKKGKLENLEILMHEMHMPIIGHELFTVPRRHKRRLRI